MKLSESSNSYKGFAFGEQKSLFIETASKRRAQKNYYWNVDPKVSKDGDDELAGFFYH